MNPDFIYLGHGAGESTLQDGDFETLCNGLDRRPGIAVKDAWISVDSAVDIAKAAASIVLLEKYLIILDEGVIEESKVFVNTLEYVRMATLLAIFQDIEDHDAAFALLADPAGDTVFHIILTQLVKMWLIR